MILLQEAWQTVLLRGRDPCSLPLSYEDTPHVGKWPGKTHLVAVLSEEGEALLDQRTRLSMLTLVNGLTPQGEEDVGEAYLVAQLPEA